MRSYSLYGFGVATLLTTGFSWAADGCDRVLTSELQRYERIVGSLHYEKSAQARVSASDGSVFTAGQATWMKTQLQVAADACAHSNGVDAAKRLAEVEQLLKEHQRT